MLKNSFYTETILFNSSIEKNIKVYCFLSHINDSLSLHVKTISNASKKLRIFVKFFVARRCRTLLTLLRFWLLQQLVSS